MARRKNYPSPPPFYDFLQAVVFDQPRAAEMLRSDPRYLEGTNSCGESVLCYAAIENYRLYTEYDRAGLETYRILADLYERHGDVWAALHAATLMMLQLVLVVG